MAVLVIVAVWASLLVSVSTAAAQPGAGGDSGTYPDTAADSYYAEPVSQLTEQGVFAGTLCEDGFCPDEAIDRKTMAVWVVRVLDEEDPGAVSESSFSDVDADSFHAPFVERMFALGVTRGCGDGSVFCPDDRVTRAEMAVLLSRAYNLPEGPDPGFSDVPDDAWYAAEVAKLAASAITKGCSDGTVFCPARDTTRAQTAAVLHRAENRGPKTHTDCPDSAYVDSIMISWRDPGSDEFTRISVKPTKKAREADIGSGGDLVVEFLRCMALLDGYGAMIYAMSHSERQVTFSPTSTDRALWQTFIDQLQCHDAPPFNIFGDTEVDLWDLEGHRPPTRNRLTWFNSSCNW